MSGISKLLLKGESIDDMCTCGHMLVLHTLPEDDPVRRCVHECPCKRFRKDKLAHEEDRMAAILAEVESAMSWARIELEGESLRGLKKMERAVKKIAKRGMRA